MASKPTAPVAQASPASGSAPLGGATGKVFHPRDDGDSEEEKLQLFKAVKRVSGDTLNAVDGGRSSNGHAGSPTKGAGATSPRSLRSGASLSSTATAPSSSSSRPPGMAKEPKPIAAFFRPKASTTSDAQSAGASGLPMKWHASLGPKGTCLVAEYGDPVGTAVAKGAKLGSAAKYQKIAAFDLDGTLIETASGKVAYNFTDENDFRIWGTTPKERQLVPQKLREQVEAGSLVVIVTSQFGLHQKPARLKMWKRRLHLIADCLGVPLYAVASVERDAYRKPCAGWVSYLRDLWRRGGGGDIELDMELGDRGPSLDEHDRSFFVGDAAGRPRGNRGKKADFADTDRKLAHNLHWRFFTPEEYFLGERQSRFSLTGHRPPSPFGDAARSADPPRGSSSTRDLASVQQRLLDKEAIQTMLFMVGPQASGKSRFATSLVEAAGSQRWVRVNRDTLKSMDRCLSVAKQALSDGKSVVVDNTNPALSSRRPFLDLARQSNKQVRLVAIHFDIPIQVAQHNDLFRSKRWHYAPSDPPLSSKAQAQAKATAAIATASPLDALPKSIPAVAFHTYYKNLQPPTKEPTGAGEADEGWDEVIRIDRFEFDDADEYAARAWRKWYA
ncbi:unnamed protein product [Parajaminaea phylloscopi]